MAERLRLLHVLPAISTGGAERLVVALANRADAAGFDVTLLTCHASAHEEMAGDLRPGVGRREATRLRLPVLGRSGRMARLCMHAAMPAWAVFHAGFLRDFDLIHVHLPLGARLGSWAHRLRRGSRPVIIESFHADWDCVSGRLRRYLARQWRRRDALILESPRSPTVAEIAASHPHVRARFIPIGAEAPRVGSVTRDEQVAWLRRAGIPDDRTLLLGTVGRMHSERQADRVVPAFAEIARLCGPGAHLAWIGDGPLRPLVERQVREMGLAGKVHLVGFDADVRVPLSLLDIALTAVNGEDCGIAGVEAILAGVPAVALQWLPDQADGGWVPSSRDPARLASIVAELAGSAGLRRELHDAQLSRARERHSMDATWAATLAFYEEILR